MEKSKRPSKVTKEEEKEEEDHCGLKARWLGIRLQLLVKVQSFVPGHFHLRNGFSEVEGSVGLLLCVSFHFQLGEIGAGSVERIQSRNQRKNQRKNWMNPRK